MQTTGIKSCFNIDGDHRSSNSKRNGQRIIIVHAITDSDPAMLTSGARVGRKKDFPRRKGGLQQTMESMALGRERAILSIEEAVGDGAGNAWSRGEGRVVVDTLGDGS